MPDLEIKGSFVEMRISGLDALEDKLEHAPLRASRRIVRVSLLAAAQIWFDQMKARVRQGPHRFKGRETEFGVLQRSIAMKARVTSDLEGTVSVGVLAKTFWAKFVEFGTALRHRGSKSGGKRRGASTGRMPAFPFARPTFDAHKQDVVDKFIESVKEQLRAEGIPVE